MKTKKVRNKRWAGGGAAGNMMARLAGRQKMTPTPTPTPTPKMTSSRDGEVLSEPDALLVAANESAKRAADMAERSMKQQWENALEYSGRLNKKIGEIVNEWALVERSRVQRLAGGVAAAAEHVEMAAAANPAAAAADEKMKAEAEQQAIDAGKAEELAVRIEKVKWPSVPKTPKDDDEPTFNTGGKKKKTRKRKKQKGKKAKRKQTKRKNQKKSRKVR